MGQLAPLTAEKHSCWICRDCGAAMRLFGIESHPTIESAELRSYVCTDCEGLQIEIVPAAEFEPIHSLLLNKAFDAESTCVLGSAFDAAWGRIEATATMSADNEQVASRRELLAKFIIANAEPGEKDRERLIESALVHLRNALGRAGIRTTKSGPDRGGQR